MDLHIRVPRVPSGAFSNLLGVAGLVAFALAIGGLTGNWWWSVLLGGVFAVGLSYIAQTHASAAEAESTVPVAAAARTQPVVRAVPTPVSA